MKRITRSLALLLVAAAAVTAPLAAFAQATAAPVIGGLQAITLTRKATPNATKPEFTSVTLLPGRAMLVQQITAFFPGKGEVEVLASPSLAETATILNDKDDANGDLAFRLGAAFLYPYPNRIRGPLSADGKTLTTTWEGHTVSIPANNIGTKPTAERHALHGLILRSAVDNLEVKQTAEGATATGIIHGGDFHGQWFSKSDLVITITLTADNVDASIVAHNVGSTPEPVAIAWHPYFNIPSGDRTQARIEIPASEMAEVDGYDNVFPTGKILPVKGTRFEFNVPGGRALGGDFLDDNFSHLDRKAGPVTVTLIDPAAHYGVKIEGLSPEIKTLQVYAPPAKNFVAIEHQTNFADPFGKEWGKMDTAMITLAPGKSTQWHVRLKVFVP